MNPTIHVQVGPIMVITRSETQGYFWLDSRDQTEVGPFNSAYDALRDFSDQYRFKLEGSPNKANIIAIDFVSRKRMNV